MSSTAIYRGIRATLPVELRQRIASLPVIQQATVLADWLAQRPLGWHWSTDPAPARAWAQGTGNGWWASLDADAQDVPIILRAHDPGVRETDERVLTSEAVFASDHPDQEVPLPAGTPLQVSMLAWWLPGQGWQSRRLRAREYAA